MCLTSACRSSSYLNFLKMKKVTLLASVLFSVVTMAQKNLKTMDEIAIQKQIIKQAYAYGDAASAINSMQVIIAKEGAASTYKDSLAILYFRTGNFASSHLLGSELLKKAPENTTLLEIEAVSLQKLGVNKASAEVYEKLFSITKNMYHGYQLANLQYSLKRLDEAKVSIQQALGCAAIEKVTIAFPIDKDKNQDVPLKAAAYNLLGIISYDLKDNSSATAAFNESLKIMPEFTVAKDNVAFLDKPLATEAQPKSAK